MSRFTQIAAFFTLLTAVLGVLTGVQRMSPWPVAVAGVCAGLWWAFGRQILGDTTPERRPAPPAG